MISFEEFESLARIFNVIPLVRTTMDDLHTPVSAFLCLHEAGQPAFLFESVEQDEKIGRYSFVGINPELLLRGKRDGVDVITRAGRESVAGSIFDVLARYTARSLQAPAEGVEGFAGGFVGYVGYPAVGHLERLDLHPPAMDEEDESMFGLFGSLLRFDHRRHRVTIMHNVSLDGKKPLRQAYEDGKKAVEALELKLRRSVTASRKFTCEISTEEGRNGREEYCAAVEKAKRYIVEGDIFQVVLSRRIRVPYEGDLFPVYRALRLINPSPYLFYIDMGDTQLAGSSPEVLVRVIGGTVEVLPIAGTRPRGKDEEDDRRLAGELLADQKELAEHVMLVDLGRNDVGRISTAGSVKVPVFKRVERYSHVMHIVSEVKGTLRDGLSSLDALKACFPAGTVSGAPKVRAMQIINELEPISRGAYAGAVGYIGLNGSLDTCIAIRTVVAHGGKLSIQVGAGIVADSVPENEFQETANKSAAMLEAVRVASAGLKMFGE